jgi:hypothetical protein
MAEAAPRVMTIYGQSLVQMWDDCPRCFWRRYVLGEKRPRDFGDTFDIADRAMKNYMASAEWIDIGVGPARMRIHSQSAWVESEPLAFPELGLAIILSGKYDAIVEDESGTKILIDYKTTHKSEEELPPYRRQLEAYRFALEHPNIANRRLAEATTIDEIGLLIYTPVKFAIKNKNSGLYGPTRWIDYPRDDGAFMRFIRDVALLLAADEPRSTECPWCEYRRAETKHTA